MDHDRKVISWRVLIVVALLLAAGFATLKILSNREIESLQAREQAMDATLGQMELDFNALYAELARVDSDSYVESKARESQGFVTDGEICFEFTNPDKLREYTAREWQVIMEEQLYSQ